MAVMDETWSDARKVWDEAVGAYEWLKSLTLGEFAEARPSSVVVADMLLAMTVPGVVIVTSARPGCGMPSAGKTLRGDGQRPGDGPTP